MVIIKYENLTLALDSIYNILSWYDRVSLHTYMQGKTLVTENAAKLLKFVKRYEWSSPKMRYNQNNILEYYDSKVENWLPASRYIENHPGLTTQIQEYLSN
ncbi:hypothetical protein [Chryseobacterium sp. YR221]|uniref:hypothetical protein n=1 Tax=Chryseobacterium sp. YR221 TaxID=1500293 RepID=UPI0009D83376|nr:hypothetical protein [Chryseobacterium sp. YR221]SMC75323.1 hypothetical protein SAMN02787074_2855 [Chryseobacterium sp. YR221]